MEVINYVTKITDGRLSQDLSYDEYGELTSKDNSSLIAQKTETINGVTVTYEHNANNQRVAKLIEGNIVEKYLWANLTTLLAVYDGNDNLVQRFEYANSRMPISMTQGSSKYYLHYDQVGSLRAVSDSSHNIIKEIIYDSFGNILSDSNESIYIPFGFAGGHYDKDTGLNRFGHRDYDSYAGKWTAKDPINFSGGDTNLYGYVLNDPVNGFDHIGLWTFGISFNIGYGAGLGGIHGINFVIDEHGNFDIQAINGVGGHAGIGAGVSANFEYTNADCVSQLEGNGYQSGGTYGEGVFGEFGRFGGPGYSGTYLGLGFGGGLTPGAFGFYGTNTVSILGK